MNKQEKYNKNFYIAVEHSLVGLLLFILIFRVAFKSFAGFERDMLGFITCWAMITIMIGLVIGLNIFFAYERWYKNEKTKSNKE